MANSFIQAGNSNEQQSALGWSSIVQHIKFYWLHAIGIFAITGIVAYLSLEFTHTFGRIAAYWPVNAIVFAVLWRWCNKPSPFVLLAAFSGNVVADYLQGDPIIAAICLSAINTFEISLTYYLLKLTKTKLNERTNFIDVTRFMVIAGGISSALAAAMAAVFLAEYFGKDLVYSFIAWYLGDALGLIIVTPCLLFFNKSSFFADFTESNRRIRGLIWLAFIGVTLTVFSQNQYPALFFIYPFMALIAYSCGFSSSTIAILFVAVTSTVASVLNAGPLELIIQDDSVKAYYLQAFLALSVVTILPLSARYNDERRANRQVREARIEAEEMRVMAETANSAKSEFLTSMSHELRTPLNAISGFGQLLQMSRGNLTLKQEEHVKSIITGSDHLIRMVDDILELAHIEHGSMSMSNEPVHIDDLLEKAVSILKPMARERSISIISNYEKQGIYVVCDAHRTLQILINLLNNAIKYNNENGEVVVSYEANDNMATVRIKDSGIGINTNFGDEIFEAFNRGDAQFGNISGTGVGLSISKKLIKAMGGDIGYRSCLSGGTEFWFTLKLSDKPCKPQVEDNLDVAAVSDEVSENEGRKGVLYVEDNDWNARLLPDALEPLEEIDVYVAKTGQDGFDMARKMRPKLIVLDIHLPDIDGFELLELLRAEKNLDGIPIFALTADATEKSRIKGMQAGFDAWLTKPINMLSLQNMVKKAVYNPSELSSNKAA